MALVPRAGYDADHDDFRASVRRFVADHVAGELDGWRAQGRFDRALVTAAAEQGFLGIAVPEDLGGAGVDDPRFSAVLVEELVSGGATGLAVVIARQVGVVVPALRSVAGAEPEAGRLLEGLGAGDLVAAVAALSPDGTVRAVPGATLADVFVLVDPAGTVAVLPRDAVAVGPPTPHLGGAEAGAASVSVELARLAGALRIEDASLVHSLLDVWAAVVSLGAAGAAFDLASDYVQERAVFGRPLASFENTRFRLAEAGAELVAAQQVVDGALDATTGESLTPALAAAARIVTARVHDLVVDQGMQLHGGYGYMREYPISHAFGDARFVRVAAAAVSEPRDVLATALGL